MAKRSVKADGINAFVELSGGDDATGATDARGMQFTDYKPEKELRTERLYFKVTPTIKAYLMTAAWENSTISRRISMTDYVCKLVEDDMQKHPEWVPDLSGTGDGEGE